MPLMCYRLLARLRLMSLLILLACISHLPSTIAQPTEEQIIEVPEWQGNDDLFRSSTFIDAEQIRKGSASSVTQLLESAANINLVSFSGSPKETRLDIRGAGQTSASNILVFIDGVRLASNDLAGTDFSALTLDNIESIQVIRGANSVRYGSGASHGVIKITTQSIRSNTLTLGSQQGNFGLANNTTGLSLKNNRHKIGLKHSNFFSDGFRDHSELDSQTSTLSYQTQLTEQTSLNLRALYYQDDYELPGPITAEESPRNASQANLFVGDAEQRLGTVLLRSRMFGKLHMEFDYSHDDRSDLIAIRPNLNSQPDQFGEQSTRSELYKTNASWQFTDAGSLQLGTDFSKIRYFRIDPVFEASRDFSPALTVDYRSRAAYLQANWRILQAALLSIGYRRDTTSNINSISLVTDPTPLNIRKQVWRNEAFEFGGHWQTDHHAFFISAAKSFRNPNGDEIQDAGDRLVPQQGEQYEAGISHTRDWLEMDIAIFKRRAKDELFFSEAAGGTNINLDQRTRRHGIESRARISASNFIDFSLMLSELSAEFTDGNKIPLVPERNVSANINIHPRPNLHLSLSYRYIGPRFDGNDQNNSQSAGPRLDSAEIYNLKISSDIALAGANLSAEAIAENIFNVIYTTAAFSGGIYPQSGRNYRAGLTLRVEL